MAHPDPIVNAILRGARRRGLDERAVLAVASVEGLHAKHPGDNGTSFGAFQEHAGGELPAWVWARGPAFAAQWADSPQGIAHALDGIARVAHGKRGRQAIAAIVSQFERPADIQGEIAKASGRYGQVGGRASGGLTRPRGILGPGGNTRSGPDPAVLQLLNIGNQMFGLDPLPALAATATRSVRPRAARQPRAQSQAAPNIRRGGRTVKWLESFAAPYGVTVTSTTSGKHVKGSYHYKGRAVDVAGSPAAMRAVAEAALRHPQDFVEMFYDPLGVYVKNGKVVKGAIGGHSDHVHLAR